MFGKNDDLYVVFEVDEDNELAFVMDEHAATDRPVIVQATSIMHCLTLDGQTNRVQPLTLRVLETANLRVLPVELAQYLYNLTLYLKFLFSCHQWGKGRRTEVASC